jgi:integrase/recombinase XerD
VKIVSPTQERAILGYLETTCSPHRDRVMFLLSMKAGLRAKEMVALIWAMVTDAAGQIARGDAPRPAQAVLFSERRGGLSPATVRLSFHRLYTSLHMDGCSSHSGRRTFITRAARKVSQVGGSLRDVQELAGHTSLAMTQRSIEGDTEAKCKLVALL